MDKNTIKRKWLIYSICGLLLTGFGLSLTGEAILSKYQSPNSNFWIAYGTLALIVFNSGLCLFGQGVIYRMQLNKLN